MNLVEFRAKYPGLYAEAAEAGARAEYDRVAGHLTMGNACGNIACAERAILNGSSVKQWLAKYEEQANRSDETSAAFVKERDLFLGRAVGAVPLQAPIATTGEAAVHLPRLTRSVGPTAGKDLGDIVADRMDAERGRTVTQ